MPKIKCETCISKNVKDLLLERFPGLRVKIEKIPECANSGDINLCAAHADGSKRIKREPSAYNVFVGQCLKGKKLTRFDPEAMKDCAKQWHQQKKS